MTYSARPGHPARPAAKRTRPVSRPDSTRLPISANELTTLARKGEGYRLSAKVGAPRSAPASNGNAQEERHQQRAKRSSACDVAQDAQRPAGLAARFDRTADTVDRLCRHRSHDAWRQIRTSPPDTSGNSSGKAFSKQSKTCRQLAEVPI